MLGAGPGGLLGAGPGGVLGAGPWGLLGVVQRQAGDESLPGRAEAVSSGRVQLGEFGAEPERGLGRRLARRDHRDDQDGPFRGEHFRDRNGAWLTQPAQAVRLGGERRGGIGRYLAGDHLGERAPTAREGNHEVLIAVLGADLTRLPDGEAG